MHMTTEFTPLPLDRLRDTAHRMKDEGWRFIQTHASLNGEGTDLYYSFMKDGAIVNYRIEGVAKNEAVPSITDIFLAAFVFENEARELFGVDMRDIAIDFQGALYGPAENEPMRVITPEQKAQIDKARKAAQAKAAKEAASVPAQNAVAPATTPANAPEPATPAAQEPLASAFVMTPEKRERFEAKLVGRTPEQIAKARACLAAKEAQTSQASSQMPAAVEPAKEPAGEAPKVDGANAAAQKSALLENAAQVTQPAAKDAELEQKLALMDDDKAERVRNALERHASSKGGE